MHGRISSQTQIDTSDSLETPIIMSIAVNALIILTTIHSQDFYDELGDRLQGRQTLPIVWQEASRMSMLIMTLAWSFGLLSIKPINHLYATAFFGLGALVGMRFYAQRDVDSDRTSYVYYNVGTLILNDIFMSLTVPINVSYQGWLTIARVIHTPVVMQLLS